MRAGRLGLALICAALVALITAASASAAACVVRKSTEAIVDDSGSMGGTDGNKLRVQALKLYMSTPGNEQKLLGATEFGSDASAVFDPGPIGPNRSAFGTALDQRIQADNGGTNYNAAFDFARVHNPNADSRIFLTDGEPTEPDSGYADNHRGGPPTHVIGLFRFISSSNEALLKRIASETGGIYRRARDAGELQAAMNDVNAVVNCQSPPKRFTNFFNKSGQSKRLAIRIPRGTRSVQFAVSWENASDSFDIGSFTIRRGGKVLARARARRLRVRKRRGSTFVTVKVSRVVRGRMRFRVRARRVSSNTFTGVRLITQASRSKRR